MEDGGSVAKSIFVIGLFSSSEGADAKPESNLICPRLSSETIEEEFWFRMRLVSILFSDDVKDGILGNESSL